MSGCSPAPYCEQHDELSALLRERGWKIEDADEVASDKDLVVLLEANVGISFAPNSMAAPRDAHPHQGRRHGAAPQTVCLYGVAGRQRTTVATTIMKLLRAAKWDGRAASPPLFSAFSRLLHRHALAVIRIDEARLHEAVAADHEGRRDRQHPGLVAHEVRQRAAAPHHVLLQIGADPDREIERERIAVVEIGQHRETAPAPRISARR